MKKIRNPFITSGYISADYFCDRVEDQRKFIGEITSGNNLALISTRRMGKTGLIQHCFQNEAIKKDYYTFFIDIYAAKSLRDFVFALSKVILETLKPLGKRALEQFWNRVRSLQAGISFDINGNPSFQVGLGDIQSASSTLDEIFSYLESAEKPCIVAIDEFQQIAGFAENNVEAILRTHVQHCKNACFVFAGSQRHTMGNMFQSASRPFYQSVSMMHLDAIPLPNYTDFARHHFKVAQKEISPETVDAIYVQFEGITWYMQKMLQVLYDMTPAGEICEKEFLPSATISVLESYKYTYPELLFRLPEKQKELLIAIAKEGKIKTVTSGDFIRKYKLASASSVQAALKGLLEKDFITRELGVYQTYDKFLRLWLIDNY